MHFSYHQDTQGVSSAKFRAGAKSAQKLKQSKSMYDKTRLVELVEVARF
jgi:hypothetical protein